MCSRARLALLVCGILMRSSVHCSPVSAGPRVPGIGSENGTQDQACDGDGNQLQNFNDSEPLGVESPASVPEEAEVLNHTKAQAVESSPTSAPGEDEVLNDLDKIREVVYGILSEAFRKLLEQLSGEKLRQKLLAKGEGGIAGGNSEDDSDRLSKRHVDGIFTDAYSRHLQKQAARTYLNSVLGPPKKND
uniref:Pituitary adenylate cyclase-activating polypeptide n=1 Tax=Desmodus rotundus TaxID=9430 RepID=M0QSA6_DESRO